MRILPEVFRSMIVFHLGMYNLMKPSRDVESCFPTPLSLMIFNSFRLPNLDCAWRSYDVAATSAMKATVRFTRKRRTREAFPVVP